MGEHHSKIENCIFLTECPLWFQKVLIYHLVLFYVYLMSLYFQFCVLHFLSKIRKLNMPPFLGRRNFLGKLETVVSLDILCVENFNEIALSHTVKEIQAVLCFTR